MGKERILLFPGNDELGFLDYFEMLHTINIYRYLQISWVSPGDPACYNSAKAIHSPHPRLEIIEQS